MFRDPEVVIREIDSFDRVYQDLPTQHLVLRKVQICEYCGAIRFPGEGPSCCYKQGKVNIVNTTIPDELWRLFTSQTDRGRRRPRPTLAQPASSTTHPAAPPPPASPPRARNLRRAGLPPPTFPLGPAMEDPAGSHPQPWTLNLAGDVTRDG